MQFYYTIRIVAFSGEEQGLKGSRAYAAEQAKIGTPIIAMLNGDMLGYTLPGSPVTLGMKDRFFPPPNEQASLTAVPYLSVFHKCSSHR